MRSNLHPIGRSRKTLFLLAVFAGFSVCSPFAADISPSVYAAEVSPEAQPQSPEQIAAREYADRLDEITSYANKAAAAFNPFKTVSASNRKELYTALNNVIVPSYSKFYYELKRLDPPDGELTELHGHYMKGAALQLQGMQLIKKSLYAAEINWTTYNQGQDKLKAGKKELALFIEGFKAYKASRM